MEWDPGPPPQIAEILARAPLDEFPKLRRRFRLEWGPIFYRGRLDGSARVLVIGQDPAADENAARRILVGHAGQRVQGFLSKLGITRSYVMLNAILYSIVGQFDSEMRKFLDQARIQSWRNELLDAVVSPKLEAILAFGLAAQHVLKRWPGAARFKAEKQIFTLTHPTARPESVIITNWNTLLSNITGKVTPDPDGVPDSTPYSGKAFAKKDLARIPLRDFGFGAPAWMGSGNFAVRAKRDGKLPGSARGKSAIVLIAPKGEA